MGKRKIIKMLIDLIEGEFEINYLPHIKFVIDHVDIYSNNEVKSVIMSGKAVMSGVSLSASIIANVIENSVDIIIGTVSALSMPIIKDKFTKILEASEASKRALFMTADEFKSLFHDEFNIKDVKSIDDVVNLLRKNEINIKLTKDATIVTKEDKTIEDKYEYLKYDWDDWDWDYWDDKNKKWSKRWEYSNYVCETC